MDYQTQTLTVEHWPQVTAIYQEGMATGQATFETRAPTWEQWDSAYLPYVRLVAVSKNGVEGWAALSSVSTRSVYAGVAEVSVYVKSSARGKGLGRALLSTLIDSSEKHGLWTLQASMFPENVASVALHRSCGFREVGRRERIGKLNGEWRDTLLLERRSKLVGRD